MKIKTCEISQILGNIIKVYHINLTKFTDAINEARVGKKMNQMLKE